MEPPRELSEKLISDTVTNYEQVDRDGIHKRIQKVGLEDRVIRERVIRELLDEILK
jgi:hypothetical protein